MPCHRYWTGNDLDLLIAKRWVSGGIDRTCLGEVAVSTIQKRHHLVVGGLGEVTGKLNEVTP